MNIPGKIRSFICTKTTLIIYQIICNTSVQFSFLSYLNNERYRWKKWLSSFCNTCQIEFNAIIIGPLLEHATFSIIRPLVLGWCFFRFFFPEVVVAIFLCIIVYTSLLRSEKAIWSCFLLAVVSSTAICGSLFLDVFYTSSRGSELKKFLSFIFKLSYNVGDNKNFCLSCWLENSYNVLITPFNIL